MTYQNGAAEIGKFSHPFQNGQIMTDSLTKSDSRINNEPIPGNSIFLSPCQSLFKKILDLRYDIIIVGINLHVRRGTLHMHYDDRNLCFPDQGEHLRVKTQSTDI